MKWKLWVVFLLVAVGAVAQTVNWKQVNTPGILTRSTSDVTNRIRAVTGTQGYIPWIGAGGATLETSTNLIFTTGVNVGIGTNVPTTLLHVLAANGVADANYVAQFINAEETTGRNYGILVKGGSDSTDWSFNIRNTSLVDTLRVTGNGNLLLGTTSSGTSLAKGLVIGNGTAATASPADVHQWWGGDIAGGGDAGAILKTEGANGWYRFGTNATFGGALTLTNNLTIGSTTGNATAIVWSAGGSATLDFGSIAATASEDLTIPVTGAAVNDTVDLGLPAAPASGIAWDAFVSSENTVTVRAGNYTALPVDPASATYKVRLFRN